MNGGLAAILTPPDLISMTSLGVPMIALYEGSAIVKMVGKRPAAVQQLAANQLAA